MKTRIFFPFSESEGGAPETSRDGQRILHFRSLLSYRMLTFREPSGAHPQHTQYETQGGLTPHGVRYTTPVVMQKSYQGILPLMLQPRINKPQPWQDGK